MSPTAFLLSIVAIGQCEVVDIALGISSSEASMIAPRVRLDLKAFNVRQTLDVIWVVGLAYDPAVLELTQVELPAGINPNPDNTYWTRPDRGQATLDFSNVPFVARRYPPPVNDEVILAHLTFDVLQPTDFTIVEVTPEVWPQREGEELGTTHVFYCREWRNFGAEDGRELRPGTLVFGLEYREFMRGDADGNATLNLSDPIAILHYLFTGKDRVDCTDAADADDDGVVNLTDAVIVLLHLFLAGPPPSGPFPEPALDPTPDGVGCR